QHFSFYDLSDASNSEVHSSPGVPGGLSPPASQAATLAGPESPPLGPTDVPLASPPPEAPSEEGDPKALQQAAEEGRAHQPFQSCSKLIDTRTTSMPQRSEPLEKEK
uniref:Uncharacterized protein n=1 Tax=Ursus maritimus TaxID=29073 RepID=A0A452VFF4_URSMA